MITNNDKYIPTPSELKLVQVLSDPTCLGMSITDKCKKAEVSREVYYNAMRKPQFVEYYNNITEDIIKEHLNDIVMATIKYGIENPKNALDRKNILTIAGLYKENPSVVNNISTLSDEELEKRLKEFEG